MISIVNRYWYSIPQLKISPPVFKQELPHLLIVFIIIMAVYVWSMPRHLVLEDDGLFIMAAYFNGVAHSPGYPLYTMLAHIATLLLPSDNVAFKVHLFTAFLGGLACLGVFYFVRCLITDRTMAYIAALTLSVTRIFWSQAIVAEVYSLNALIFIMLLIILLLYQQQRKPSYLYLAAFIFGLGLSNHWPLTLLCSLGFLLMICPMNRSDWFNFSKAIPFVLIGLLPYVYMVYRSQANPEFNFLGPIDSWDDFWFIVSRQAYNNVDNSITAGWWDKWYYLGFVLKESANQYQLLGTILIIIGFIAQFRILPKMVVSSLIGSCLGPSVLLILLLNFDYDYFHQTLFRVYPIPIYLILSVWLAVGTYVLLNVIRQHRIHLYPIIKKSIAILLWGVPFLTNANEQYQAYDPWAETYGTVLLHSLKPNAVFITSEDLDLNVFMYLQTIKGLRPDISLYNISSYIINNRLFDPVHHTHAQKIALVQSFVDNTNKPIYYSLNATSHPALSRYSYIDFNLYRKVDKNIQRNHSKKYPYTTEWIDDIYHYMSELTQQPIPLQPFKKIYYLIANNNYCRTLLKMNESNPSDEWQQSCKTYQGQLILLSHLLESNESSFNAERAQKLLAEAYRLKHQAINKMEQSHLYLLQGTLYQLNKQKQKAIQAYQKSINVWQHPNNYAKQALSDINSNHQ